MANLINFGGFILNMDHVQAVNEEDGKVTVYHSYGKMDITGDIKDFWRHCELYADSNETEKELARVTRDYEELARENDRLKEMNLQLLTAHGRRVYKKMTHKINLEDIYDSESGDE